MKNTIQIEDAMIFIKEFNGRKVYSLGISGKKYEAGQSTNNYVNSYLTVQFSKCEEPEDRQRIDIVNAFLTAYEGNDGKGKLKLVVLEWRTHSDSYF